MGCRRKANEDWYAHFTCANGLVAVVCDGMGGHVGGAVASHLAVDTIKSFLEQNYFDDPFRAIIEACDAANAAILRRTREQPELTGMGSTCVMLIVRNGKVYTGCVGDSRIYLVRSNQITQLTEDQSYVQMLVNAGEISKEQAEHHPRKNEILNALGLPTMQQATVREEAINPEAGDVFLLCSDGLSGMVSDEEIKKVAGNLTGMSQQARVDTLIQKARQHGGLDNITCVMVEFAVTPSTGGRVMTRVMDKRVKYGLLGVVGILCVLLCIYGIIKIFGGETQKQDSTEHVQNAIAGKKTVAVTDTILWEKGKKCVEVELHGSLGARIRIYGKQGKNSVDVRYEISADSVSIEPKGNFSKTTRSDGDDTVITYEWNDAEWAGNCLWLTLASGDSTCVYQIPVEQPGAATTVKTAETPAQTNKEEPKGIFGTIKSTVTNLFSTGSKGSNSTDEKPADTETDGGNESSGEEKLEFTIPVSREGQTEIEVKSSGEANTNKRICLENYALEVTSIKESWFTYECNDGRTGRLLIENAKVPEGGGEVRVPIANYDDKVCIIRVKQK